MSANTAIDEMMLISAFHHQEFAAALQAKNEALIKDFIAKIHEKDLKDFSTMIFSDVDDYVMPTSPSQSHFSFPRPIYNYSQYFSNKNVMGTKGAKLELPDDENTTINDPDTPIGYQIFLLDGEVKGLLTEVYGGSSVLDHDNIDSYRSPEIRNFMLIKGIEYAHLFLVDIIQNDVSQRYLDADLHKRQHKCIGTITANSSFTFLPSPPDPGMGGKKLDYGSLSNASMHQH